MRKTLTTIALGLALALTSAQAVSNPALYIYQQGVLQATLIAVSDEEPEGDDERQPEEETLPSTEEGQDNIASPPGTGQDDSDASQS